MSQSGQSGEGPAEYGREALSQATRAASSELREDVEEPSKEDLLEHAQRLDIRGRSTMSKEELARAIEAEERPEDR